VGYPVHNGVKPLKDRVLPPEVRGYQTAWAIALYPRTHVASRRPLQEERLEIPCPQWRQAIEG